MRYNQREEFDRDREYETVRPCLIRGKTLEPGKPFDKTLVNTRRLRQMYDTRWLKMVPLPDPATLVRPPVKATPSPPAPERVRAKRVRAQGR